MTDNEKEKKIDCGAFGVTCGLVACVLYLAYLIGLPFATSDVLLNILNAVLIISVTLFIGSIISLIIWSVDNAYWGKRKTPNGENK